MDEIDTAPGAGNVTLTLGGREVVLKPCADCALRLSRLAGGIYITPGSSTCVYTRVASCDIETMCEVIRAGVGAGVSADRQLPAKIYDAGLFAVRDALKDFLFNLGNRGRPLAVEGDKAEGAAAQEDDGPLGSELPSSDTTSTS